MLAYQTCAGRTVTVLPLGTLKPLHTFADASCLGAPCSVECLSDFGIFLMTPDRVHIPKSLFDTLIVSLFYAS
jgi:hypothetical protein